MLLLGAAVLYHHRVSAGTRCQRLMVPDRLDLALGDLLDLLRAFTCHSLDCAHVGGLGVIGRVMRIRQVRGLLLAFALRSGLSSHLAGDHVLETADHFWALGPASLSVLASQRSGRREIIIALRFCLVLAPLYLMNKFVLDLIGGRLCTTSRPME